jgi:hypothetical protein
MTSNVIDLPNSNDYPHLEDGEYNEKDIKEKEEKEEREENDRDVVEYTHPLFYLKMIAIDRTFKWKNIYV